MLANYVGQRDALAPLMAAITSSRTTGRALPNMLFLGGPGRGKTTLAKAVAEETGKRLITLHGSSTLDRDDVGNKIQAAENGILFIDEVHALPRQLAESLYRVIDEHKMTLLVPKMEVETKKEVVWADTIEQLPQSARWQWSGPSYYNAFFTYMKETKQKETLTVDMAPITIIGATTDEALLPEPFYSRLSALMVRLRPYTRGELMDIAMTHAKSLNVVMTPMAAETIADRSRQTPRRVKHLTERAVDLTVNEALTDVWGKYVMGESTANAALHSMDVDQYGLEEPHRAILRTLAANEKGLSRTTLAQSVGIPPRNLDTYWGDLVALGMVSIATRHEITDQGRSAI